MSVYYHNKLSIYWSSWDLEMWSDLLKFSCSRGSQNLGLQSQVTPFFSLLGTHWSRWTTSGGICSYLLRSTCRSSSSAWLPIEILHDQKLHAVARQPLPGCPFSNSQNTNPRPQIWWFLHFFKGQVEKWICSQSTQTFTTLTNLTHATLLTDLSHLSDHEHRCAFKWHMKAGQAFMKPLWDVHPAQVCIFC